MAEEPFNRIFSQRGYSKVRDMWKYSRAFTNGKIITQKYADIITGIKTDKIWIAQGYGYGMIIHKNQDEISFGHGDTSYGVNFEYGYFPNLDITLIMFCNRSSVAYDDLKRNTKKLITGEIAALPKTIQTYGFNPRIRSSNYEIVFAIKHRGFS